MATNRFQSRRQFLGNASWAATAWMIAGTCRGDATGSSPSLEILDPIDGAMFHQRLGRKVDGGLEIEIRGRAPASATVLVQGRPAVRDGEFFRGPAVLTDCENEVVVLSRNGTNEQEAKLRLPWIKNSRKRYRFVIDDNSFFLRDITQKGYGSLFDCFYLKMLRDLHTQYGAQFTLNIYFTTGEDWNLQQFPEKYRDEWQENASWLRLAFHAYANDPPAPYNDAPVEKLLADLEQVEQQIHRFAGPAAHSPTTVVHFGMTRPEAWKPLYEKGSRVLSGYFQDQGNGQWWVNYNMDPFRSEWLSRHDLLKDYPSGIVFSKVDLVVNSTPLEQIIPKLDAVMADPLQNEVIDLLTHEQYFWPFYQNYLPDHAQRMDRAIKYVTQNGYQSVFLQDEFDETRS